jgi:hypothetical protein
MEITALKLVVLLCFLMLPLMGSSKRRKIIYKRPDRTVMCSNYVINEDGELEEIFNRNNN